MASGRLGASDLSATTNTTVYTAPVGKTASITITVCCRSTTGAAIRLALSATGTPGASEWLEYDTVLGYSGIIEHSGLVLAATQNVVAYSSTANVNVIVVGVEE